MVVVPAVEDFFVGDGLVTIFEGYRSRIGFDPERTTGTRLDGAQHLTPSGNSGTSNVMLGGNKRQPAFGLLSQPVSGGLHVFLLHIPVGQPYQVCEGLDRGVEGAVRPLVEAVPGGIADDEPIELSPEVVQTLDECEQQRRIPGVPLSAFDPSKISRDKPVIVYCASGARSGMAQQQLLAAGFSDVRNYRPGFGIWKMQGGAVN